MSESKVSAIVFLIQASSRKPVVLLSVPAESLKSNDADSTAVAVAQVVVLAVKVIAFEVEDGAEVRASFATGTVSCELAAVHDVSSPLTCACWLYKLVLLAATDLILNLAVVALQNLLRLPLSVLWVPGRRV